ncbi:MAG TPA: hypothetical protein VFJ58_22105 [Armatimonadota bacterium]|nr:hypothetical protein [Armatimonadota bacterium]
MSTTRALLSVALVLGIATAFAAASAEAPPKRSIKTESFDRDPGWEGYNNRLLPGAPPSITLDGARYSWTMTYDPDANEGGGRFRWRLGWSGELARGRR